MKSKPTKKTDPERAAYKKFMSRHLEAVRKHLMLHIWEIGVSYNFFKQKDDGKSSAIAEITVNLKYYSAHVNFYQPAFDMWKERKFEELIHVIIHELSHIITEPIFQQAFDNSSPHEYTFLQTTREQQTEHIAIVVDKLLHDSNYVYR